MKDLGKRNEVEDQWWRKRKKDGAREVGHC